MFCKLTYRHGQLSPAASPWALMHHETEGMMLRHAARCGGQHACWESLDASNAGSPYHPQHLGLRLLG